MEKRIKIIIITYLILLTSCINTNIEGDFKSKKLTSSKGENLYINTLNWGITNDYQLTVISKNLNQLKKRKDSIGAIKGLTPFIYSFKNDTLELISIDNIKVQEKFKTIKIKYTLVKNYEYTDLIYSITQGQNKTQYNLIP